MAKLTVKQVKMMLSDIERRLRAGENLTTHAIEVLIKSAGKKSQRGQRLIKKHGSSSLLAKYIESFDNHVPAELKNS